MYYNTCKEKRDSNDLVQGSKNEAIDKISVANSLVAKSISLEKSVEEMELRQSNASKLKIRKLWVKSSEKINCIKNILSEEKRNKKMHFLSLKEK